MNINNIIGIDLAKNSMHVFIRDAFGKKVLSKKVARIQLIHFLKSLGYTTIVGLEACGSAHYWGRMISKLGFTVRLIPPQHVKPFVKTNKNDEKDAEAISEAVTRENIPFVSIKTVDQQEGCMIHRVREGNIVRRTALINEARSHLSEFGIFLDQGAKVFKKQTALLLDPSADNLSQTMREILQVIVDDIEVVEKNIKTLETKLKALTGEHEVMNRLQTVPGIGLITSTILYAQYGQAKDFKNGRHFSASLGVVPRHSGTGGKTRIGGMSKRGNNYVRKMLIHGARAAVLVSKNKTDPLNLWIQKKRAEKGLIKASIALANKNARIAWRILNGDGIKFDPTLAASKKLKTPKTEVTLDLAS